MDDKENIRISVRTLVEFILRAGDIDNRSSHADMNAMQEGSRLHKKLQKEEAGTSHYRSEVSLKIKVPVTYGDESFRLTIEGRADGIYEGLLLPELFAAANPEREAEELFKGCEVGADTYIIDEIKTTYADVDYMSGPVPVHRSQAMCYAAIYASNEDLPYMAIRMTYCNQETLAIKHFYEFFTRTELEEWFGRLIREYAKWAAWERKWTAKRNATILDSAFPFEYRPGQKKLVGDVYRTINRGKKLFIEAPTGVGKTISTVYPAVWAMGEGKVEKLFYGTAKTIARTVAEEAFTTLASQGISIKTVTITAKEKICILEKPECNPLKCVRAKGHFDRVNDAVYDMLLHEESITRPLIEKYAAKHNVCPFEMCLDVSTWADAVICDYNYIFDPHVHLKRFFEDGAKHDYCFLLDEAHNLPERAREMYSAMLVKEDFLRVKNCIAPGAAVRYPKDSPKGRLSAALNACNKAMLELKHRCESFEVMQGWEGLLGPLMRFSGCYEELSRFLSNEDNEAIVELYFNVRHFLEMNENADDEYLTYADYSAEGEFRLHLQCMDPSGVISRITDSVRSTVFFSATLLPISYYSEQLGGRSDDYRVYAPSPFDPDNRLLMVAGDVSTKYTRRSDGEYERIAEYIKLFTQARTGNYLIFFPSYRMLNDIAEKLEGRLEGIRLQSQNMTEQEKEEFLDSFTAEPECSNIGFCVMGGIFAEGIDLKADRLIGVVVVGTGLPMVCNERELFRDYFEEKKGSGFEYAYLYNGMNKVMQAAGRVIRTMEDRGAILLLDERFLNRQYRELFPMEWDNYKTVSVAQVGRELENFWRGEQG